MKREIRIRIEIYNSTKTSPIYRQIPCMTWEALLCNSIKRPDHRQCLTFHEQQTLPSVFTGEIPHTQI